MITRRTSAARSVPSAVPGWEAPFVPSVQVDVQSASAGTAHAPGDGVIRSLDARTVRPSAWSNRHPRAFICSDFEKLKASVQAVGTNIQPIRVRPIPPEAQQPGDARSVPPIDFEIIFGHRRHRACLDLGVPVAAVVVQASDKELFSQMDRENRTHKPLSPFEQGTMFQLALDSGLYESARTLAQELDVDASLVSKALSIARLPQDVIQAFVSPLDIQYRWAGPLKDAQRKDSLALITRAQLLQIDKMRMTSVRIFQRLVAARLPTPGGPSHVQGRHGRATIHMDRKGRLSVLIEPPWGADIPKLIEIALREILDRPVSHARTADKPSA